MSDNITLPREVVEAAVKALMVATTPIPADRQKVIDSITALRTHLAAPKQKHPGYVIGSHWLETAYSRVCAGEAEADVLRDIGLVREEAFLTGVAHLKAENEALRRDAERYRWLREWLDNNGLLIRAIRGESLAGYEHPDIEALRRDAERLKDAMRKAMAMLDKHEPEPAGAFAVLLLALNPELQSAKNAALRREE